MSENHLWVVFAHHVLKHGSKAFTYFDYDKNNYLSEGFKAVSNTKQKYDKVSLKGILANEKAIKEAQKFSS